MDSGEALQSNSFYGLDVENVDVLPDLPVQSEVVSCPKPPLKSALKKPKRM